MYDKEKCNGTSVLFEPLARITIHAQRAHCSLFMPPLNTSIPVALKRTVYACRCGLRLIGAYAAKIATNLNDCLFICAKEEATRASTQKTTEKPNAHRTILEQPYSVGKLYHIIIIMACVFRHSILEHTHTDTVTAIYCFFAKMKFAYRVHSHCIGDNLLQRLFCPFNYRCNTVELL